MTRREWWIWRGRNWDVDDEGLVHDIGPVSELYVAEVDPVTDRVVSAWGPLDRWTGHGHSPTRLLPWERVLVPLPRLHDGHGTRLPGKGPVVPLTRLLLASPAVVGTLEHRRAEFERLEAHQALEKKDLTAGHNGLRLSSVG